MGWGPPWWQAHAPGTARAPAGREKKGGGGGVSGAHEAPPGEEGNNGENMSDS